MNLFVGQTVTASGRDRYGITRSYQFTVEKITDRKYKMTDGSYFWRDGGYESKEGAQLKDSPRRYRSPLRIVEPVNASSDPVGEFLGIDLDGERIKCGDCDQWTPDTEIITFDAEQTVRCPICAAKHSAYQTLLGLCSSAEEKEILATKNSDGLFGRFLLGRLKADAWVKTPCHGCGHRFHEYECNTSLVSSKGSIPCECRAGYAVSKITGLL